MAGVRGNSILLSTAEISPVPDVTPSLFPGTLALSDNSDDERVVRVWTNENVWWLSSFDADDISQVRAFAYVTEESATNACVSVYPVRPRGTAFGVRPGNVSVKIAAWSLDGAPIVDANVTKVNVSISAGRPQLHAVATQSVAAGQNLWFQPDKFNGCFSPAPGDLRWGVRFCDQLRVSWTQTGGGAGAGLQIARGNAPVTTDLTAEWGQVDIAVDNIVQVRPLGPNVIATATALVYR